MSTKFSVSSPVTQSREAVESLITYLTGTAPVEMPATYRVSGDVALVRSKDGKAYYTVTTRGCSCPAATYHPGTACKHRRAAFPPAEVESIKPRFDEPFRPYTDD